MSAANPSDDSDDTACWCLKKESWTFHRWFFEIYGMRPSSNPRGGKKPEQSRHLWRRLSRHYASRRPPYLSTNTPRLRRHCSNTASGVGDNPRMTTIHRRDPARRRAWLYVLSVLTFGAAELVAGCAQRAAVPPAPPPRAAKPVQPPDWFHQQLAAARAARRAHQPQTDTVGAQKAYDDVLRTACTQAALAGPGKYPARCDAILKPAPKQPTDPCASDTDDSPECSD
jgi:hypothetical protein